MKSSVFPLLRLLSDGEFHSGEVLATQFGLSRGAVWYQVRRAEQYGLRVFKVRGRGYRLSRPLDLLDPARLAALLASDAPRMSASVLEECDSTSAELARNEAAAHGAVVVCEYQHAGRGRRGNAWHSGVGTGLTFSFKWRFSQGSSGLSGLSLAVSVAVVTALESLGYRGIELKWPNDLQHDGRKLGGILVEVRGDPQGPVSVIVGIGLNVDLPAELKAVIDQPVTDLATVRSGNGADPQGAPDRTTILAAMLASLQSAFERYEREGFAPFRPLWSGYDAHRGRRISIRLGDREIASGEAAGIAEDGAILVRTAEGERSFHSGEVSVR
jgi:BirA family biotin operon repressor/biotin-[acetyl-CoA-carboxylase] ligase